MDNLKLVIKDIFYFWEDAVEFIKVYQGNPAGVVLDGGNLTEEKMQRIEGRVRELNR